MNKNKLDATTLYNIYRSIKHFIHKTPLITCDTFSQITETKNLYFKCENFQKTGSFKLRGAVYALQTYIHRTLRMNQTIDNLEVITHSSGNHASALSYAGNLFGVKIRVVMPSNGPTAKREAVRTYGGEITLCEPTQKSRELTTELLMARKPMQLVHSSDNYLIIGGQSTVAYEVFKEIGDLDYILTPLGGGGLLAGTCLSAVNFSPKTKVIGVEPSLANDAYLSFKSGAIHPPLPPLTIADGLRIGVGVRNFEIMQKHLHDIMTVEEEEIMRATFLIWERMKIVVEPSSATTLAALIKYRRMFRNKNVALVLSGGNVDLRNLPFSRDLIEL